MCHIGQTPISSVSNIVRASTRELAVAYVAASHMVAEGRVTWSRLRKYWSRCRRDEKFHRTGIKCPRRCGRWRGAWLWNEPVASSTNRLCFYDWAYVFSLGIIKKNLSLQFEVETIEAMLKLWLTHRKMCWINFLSWTLMTLSHM